MKSEYRSHAERLPNVANGRVFMGLIVTPFVNSPTRCNKRQKGCTRQTFGILPALLPFFWLPTRYSFLMIVCQRI